MSEDCGSSLVPAVVGLALALRGVVGLYGYSGEAQPPRFGDYEAQRHWMEITLNLPASEWYVESADNALEYWGLDYPPLSAYFSLALGTLARAAGHAPLVELHASRGHESASSRGPR